jgi:hypothetical protein
LTPHEKFGFSVYGSYGAEQGNGNSNGTFAGVGSCPQGTAGCDPNAKRVVVGGIITIKPVDTTTLILEPYYGNEGNAAGTSTGAVGNPPTGNARWNGIIAYLIHDFNDQTKPNAFSFRARGELWEDAGGARACAGAFNVVGNTNTCAGTTNGSPTSLAVTNNPFGGGNGMTAWETTFTLQWKPAPALQTRVEYRYDHANENAYLHGTRAVNYQNTLGFSVAYMW